MKDLLIYETGNGGDLVLRGSDMAGVDGYENQPYLAMFGGGGWWGNFLLGAKQKFLCKTEGALRSVALNSAGRLTIEAAIGEDLAYLQDIPGTTVSYTTAIAGNNRLDIEININGQQFFLQWNPDALFLNYKVG